MPLNRPTAPQGSLGPFGPSSDLPLEIGLEKILLFPHKLTGLFSNLTGADQTYPISVELSLTSRCNLSCNFCSDLILRQNCPDNLEISRLKDLFIDLAHGGTRGVTIEGGGEPTISPLFKQAVLTAKAQKLSVGLITNGAELFKGSISKQFYSNFQWIRISLDASNAQQYKLIKGSDRFQAVLDNLAALTTIKPKPVLGLGYVLTNQNDQIDSLIALTETLSQMGADYLHLRPVVDRPNLVSKALPENLSALSRPGFSVNLAAMTDNMGQGNDGLPCLAHSLSVAITADGSVWLCGRLGSNPTEDAMGNLCEASFSEIWRGPRRLKQAKLAAQESFCRLNCPQCRMTKYNRLLNRLSQIKTKDFI
ncbi:MAG: radical SAM protein [Deltaproteobacteria bacterium]|jgi:radical SAM protein with 4Fe4S-binding SPASM domain|nr:radical SAM protein [Deltaproteobacteria bacterium]